MIARPILFSAPTIRALLNGRKTQTRRVLSMSLQETATFLAGDEGAADDLDLRWGTSRDDDDQVVPAQWLMACAEYPEEGVIPAGGGYGNIGDLLWVREAWQYANWTDDGLPFIGYRASGVTMLREAFPESWTERLIEIWAELSKDDNFQIDGRAADRRWRPSIHMPRWASRITLKITGVRVERLQDISEADAIKEGLAPVTPSITGCSGWAVERFCDLWESIHGPGSWNANPWIWALTFDVILANVDEVKP